MADGWDEVCRVICAWGSIEESIQRQNGLYCKHRKQLRSDASLGLPFARQLDAPTNAKRSDKHEEKMAARTHEYQHALFLINSFNVETGQLGQKRRLFKLKAMGYQLREAKQNDLAKGEMTRQPQGTIGIQEFELPDEKHNDLAKGDTGTQEFELPDEKHNHLAKGDIGIQAAKQNDPAKRGRIRRPDQTLKYKKIVKRNEMAGGNMTRRSRKRARWILCRKQQRYFTYFRYCTSKEVNEKVRNLISNGWEVVERGNPLDVAIGDVVKITLRGAGKRHEVQYGSYELCSDEAFLSGTCREVYFTLEQAPVGTVQELNCDLYVNSKKVDFYPINHMVVGEEMPKKVFPLAKRRATVSLSGLGEDPGRK